MNDKYFRERGKEMAGINVQTTMQDFYGALAEAIEFDLRYVVRFKSGYKAMRNPSSIGVVCYDRAKEDGDPDAKKLYKL